MILAGVTIALVVGDNGILNQAVNAADETNRANAQTELEMAVSAVVADWSGARYLDGNDETLEEYLTQDRVETNMNTDEYALTAFTLNTQEGVTVNYRGKDYKFTVEITSSGNSAKVTYGSSTDLETPVEPEDPEAFVPQIDGSWNEEKKVNSPELFEGMTAVYWDDEGVEHELTSSSKEEEWDQWYDYNGQGDGQNKWANAVTKDSSGNITGYWVWIPRYAYKIESGLFTSTAGTISVKFLQGTSDLDEDGTTISRNYAYSENTMTDYVVHPAFRNGTDNNFMLGEWDEEVNGFWVAKYEAGYQANAITYNNGTLSTTISNSDDPVVYSDLKYTSYESNLETNALGQDLSNTNYSTQNLSYPVFLPLTYSYNNICIGDSYVLSQAIDTANNFYGLNSSITDSHQIKNSEWGAVSYLAQSNYGRNGTEITINDYYTNSYTESPYKTAITGLVSSDESETVNQTIDSMSAYDTINGYKGNTTGNITGVYDLSGGVWERTSAYISNGNSQLISDGNNSTYGSSGYLLGAINTEYPNGYQTLSKRDYTVYSYNSENDDSILNYTINKELLSNTYGYGDSILETSLEGSGTTSWNSQCSYFAFSIYPFFNYGGISNESSDGTGLFAFYNTDGRAYHFNGFRAVLINE